MSTKSKSEYQTLIIDGISYNTLFNKKFEQKQRWKLPNKNKIFAPVAGTIIEIKIQEGSHVKKGDTILILEAMKMQNHIKSTREGTVHKIHINKGDRITKDTCLIEFS